MVVDLTKPAVVVRPTKAMQVAAQRVTIRHLVAVVPEVLALLARLLRQVTAALALPRPSQAQRLLEQAAAVAALITSDQTLPALAALAAVATV